MSFAPYTYQAVRSYEEANGIASHGTIVSNIVGRVAPETTLLALNVFQPVSGEIKVGAATSSIVSALAWVASNANAYNIVAANMSLGSTSDDPETCNNNAYFDPIRVLWEDYGVLSVIASGNDGKQNAVSSPGCVSLAVTVGV